jgi:hypothetical protein
MKPKFNQQAQPPDDPSLRNRQAEDDLIIFQIAVASYAERVSREDGVSFQQHLREVLEKARSNANEHTTPPKS